MGSYYPDNVHIKKYIEKNRENTDVAKKIFRKRMHFKESDR